MDLEIVRPVSQTELIWDLMNRDGMLLVSYNLSLSSRKPLQLDIVEKALHILPIKVPSLGVFIREINGEHFFCKQNPIVIDFKICQNVETKNVVHEAVHIPLDSHNGPMWKARLVQPPHFTEGKDYPYNCNIVFVFTHSLTDGNSNVSTCNYFLSILNDLIEGNTISDEPFNTIGPGDWTVKHFENAKRRLREDPELYSKIDEEYKFFVNRKSPMNRLSPHDPNPPNSTCFIMKTLDEETSKNLTKQFKNHGVTFHAGLTAHINRTIIRLLEKRQLLKTDNVEISCTHVISTRRFDEGNKNSLGIQVATVNMSIVESKDSPNSVWSSAKRTEKEIKKVLHDQTFGLIDVLVEVQNEADGTKNTFFELDQETPMMDYSTSNMGNITPKFSGDGKHVICDSLFRQSTLHKFGEVFHIICHTFREKFHFSFCYASKYMSESVAEEFVLEFVNVLKETADNLDV